MAVVYREGVCMYKSANAELIKFYELCDKLREEVKVSTKLCRIAQDFFSVEKLLSEFKTANENLLIEFKAKYFAV